MGDMKTFWAAALLISWTAAMIARCDEMIVVSNSADAGVQEIQVLPKQSGDTPAKFTIGRGQTLHVAVGSSGIFELQLRQTSVDGNHSIDWRVLEVDLAALATHRLTEIKVRAHAMAYRKKNPGGTWETVSIPDERRRSIWRFTTEPDAMAEAPFRFVIKIPFQCPIADDPRP